MVRGVQARCVAAGADLRDASSGLRCPRGPLAAPCSLVQSGGRSYNHMGRMPEKSVGIPGGTHAFHRAGRHQALAVGQMACGPSPRAPCVRYRRSYLLAAPVRLIAAFAVADSVTPRSIDSGSPTADGGRLLPPIH